MEGEESKKYTWQWMGESRRDRGREMKIERLGGRIECLILQECWNEKRRDDRRETSKKIYYEKSSTQPKI